MKELTKEKPLETKEKKSVGHIILSIIGTILCIILIPVLIINSILIIKGIANDKEVPQLGGYYPMIVLSGSMEDTIMTGDLIIGKSAKIDEIKEGDIISFYDGSSVVTHRVISIDVIEGEKMLTTKGDANNSADPKKVTKDNLIGKYVKLFPGLGDKAMFMQSTKGLIICVICPIVVFVLYDVLRRKKYTKQEKAETENLKAELEALRLEKEKLTSQVKEG